MLNPAVIDYLRSVGKLPPEDILAGKDGLVPPTAEVAPAPSSAPEPLPAPMPAPAPAPADNPYAFGGKEAAAVGLAGLGDALSASAGRSTSNAKNTLDTIQTAPAKAAERATALRTAQDLAEKDDPSSATSKMYQSAAAKYTGKKPEELAGVSATKLEKIFPTLEKFAATQINADNSRQAHEDNLALRESMFKSGQDWKNHVFGEKEDQFNQKQWNDFQNKNDPMNSGSRTVIGMLGRANLQGKRALNTLQNSPMVTNADLGNVIADIAGIYAGGAPTDMGMKHQSYDTMFSKLKSLQQYFTGKPTDAVPDAVKQKIIGTLNDMMNTNTEMLKSHNTNLEKRNKWLLEKHPEEWKEFRAGLEGGEQAGDNSGGGSQEHNAALEWANAHPTDPRAAAIKQKAQAALQGK